MNANDTARTLKRELKQKLLATGSPRLQMSFILIFTGLGGFAASALLRALGLDTMALRYLIAAGVSYATFLLCIHLWIRYVAAREMKISIDADTVEDAVDLVDDATDINVSVPRIIPASGHSSSNELEGIKGLFSVDLDEGAIVVIIAVLALALIAIAAYFIFIAPAFLAEIFTDALLVGGLYRKVKNLQASDWLPGAIKGSWVFFLVIAVIFTAGGYLIQYIDPEITTLTQAVKAAAAAW